MLVSTDKSGREVPVRLFSVPPAKRTDQLLNSSVKAPRSGEELS